MVSYGRDRQAHRHIPSQDPVIPRSRAKLAQKILDCQMVGEPHPVTGEKITREQSWAAHELIKLYQTQDRYSPERVKQLAASPKASQNVRELDALDDEALNRLTARMVAEAQA